MNRRPGPATLRYFPLQWDINDILRTHCDEAQIRFEELDPRTVRERELMDALAYMAAREYFVAADQTRRFGRKRMIRLPVQTRKNQGGEHIYATGKLMLEIAAVALGHAKIETMLEDWRGDVIANERIQFEDNNWDYDRPLIGPADKPIDWHEEWAKTSKNAAAPDRLNEMLDFIHGTHATMWLPLVPHHVRTAVKSITDPVTHATIDGFIDGLFAVGHAKVAHVAANGESWRASTPMDHGMPGVKLVPWRRTKPNPAHDTPKTSTPQKQQRPR